MEPSTVIEGRDIVRTFADGTRRIEVLRGASLSLAAGQIGALLGRSGSGKSTLLQMLGLLAAPDAGTVRISGRDTKGMSSRQRAKVRAKDLGFVFQASNLLPQHNALNNVVLPFLGSPSEGRARATLLLEDLGLGDRTEHRPDQLSGGEQQRVALARAMINEPVVILADEPTGSLDATNEHALLDVLRALAARGTAVLLITHSESVAATAAVRWSLDDGRVTGSEIGSEFR